MAMRSKEQRKPMRPEFSAELESYFAADVERLSAMLDRDLMHWVGHQPRSNIVSAFSNDASELVTSEGTN